MALARTGGMSVGSWPLGPNRSEERLADWLLNARAKKPARETAQPTRAQAVGGRGSLRAYAAP